MRNVKIRRRLLEKEVRGIGPFLDDSQLFSVEMLDLNLLEKPGPERKYDYRFILFDKNGDLMGEMGVKTEERKRGALGKWFRGEESRLEKVHFKENLVQAIERLDPEGSKTGCILQIVGIWLTLHRVPSGVDIKTHIANLEAKEIEKINNNFVRS